MKKVLETAMILMGTLGFWGFVYPELCLTQETSSIESEEDVENFLDGEGKIRIKCKALEYVYQVSEKEDTEKDSIK